MRSSSRGSRSRTAPSRRSAGSTSPLPPDPCSGCWARTAPARPPRCGSSPRCSTRTPAVRASPGSTSCAMPAALRAQIGLAGQYAAVDENLTGAENLEMVGRLYHLGRSDSRQRADELLERFDLTDAAKRPGQDLLGRHAPPARPRRRARRPAAGAVPRRADHRAGSPQPHRHVGDDRGARGRRHHGAAHDPVPRRGRPARRRDRGDRPRPRDRRGHLGRAQEPDRRRARRDRARGPGRRRRRDRGAGADRRGPPDGRRRRRPRAGAPAARADPRDRPRARRRGRRRSTTSPSSGRRWTTCSSRSPATRPRTPRRRRWRPHELARTDLRGHDGPRQAAT